MTQLTRAGYGTSVREGGAGAAPWGTGGARQGARGGGRLPSPVGAPDNYGNDEEGGGAAGAGALRTHAKEHVGAIATTSREQEH